MLWCAQKTGSYAAIGTADIAPPTIRDASFALYFTLAFGVGSLWTALYGVSIDAIGNGRGLVIVFWVMAATFVAAALAVARVRAGRRRPAGELRGAAEHPLL